MALVSGHFWVPIDDTTTMTWSFLYAADESVPLTQEFAINDEIHAGRGPDQMIPGTFRLKRNNASDHLIDRELQPHIHRHRWNQYSGRCSAGR